jgi:xanthine dehydrogenase YagS FAD-binding subunit
MTVMFYDRPSSIEGAMKAAPDGINLSSGERAYVAGGTELIPLMRAGIARPRGLVDLRWAGLPATIERGAGGNLIIGSSATMSDVAAHPLVRDQYPVLSQALLASASAQVRNVASIGGNLMQRTRCSYFRDTIFPCNKRLPGSGCPAQEGDSRRHAIFGGSSSCVAVHSSDLAVALAALDASLRLRGPAGERQITLGEFYLDPGETPWRETVLEERELIVAVDIPEPGRGSAYVKVRDRASFEFALVSAAAVVRINAARVSHIAIALGGVAPHPWRLARAEKALTGQQLTRAAITAAVRSSMSEARPLRSNGFKVDLVCRAAERAVALAGGMA